MGGVFFGPSTPASALTKEQWKECREKYQGLEVYNDPELRQNWEKFLNNKCYVGNGGNCGTIHLGSGTFSGSRADCPISDKYIKEAEAYEPEVITGGGTDDGPNDCGGADTAIIKCNADNSGGITNNAIWALLIMAINILTAGIGIAAVGGIIYGSMLYTTAGDNDGQVKQSKKVIRNVVIG
ncbi:MAG: hypothetical protein ACSLEY_03200, partial [Candidatus Saccharimonadales bacterium]